MIFYMYDEFYKLFLTYPFCLSPRIMSILSFNNFCISTYFICYYSTWSICSWSIFSVTASWSCWEHFGIFYYFAYQLLVTWFNIISIVQCFYSILFVHCSRNDFLSFLESLLSHDLVHCSLFWKVLVFVSIEWQLFWISICD
jgi:hypothetical protein